MFNLLPIESLAVQRGRYYAGLAISRWAVCPLYPSNGAHGWFFFIGWSSGIGIERCVEGYWRKPHAEINVLHFYFFLFLRTLRHRLNPDVQYECHHEI